ncbi:MAG: altronate hydrolase [Blastocatellia bacterium]
MPPEVRDLCSGDEELLTHDHTPIKAAKRWGRGKATCGTTISNAIAPVSKLASNTPVFERMAGDLDLSAGGVIDGSETIDEVGARVFEHLRQVASGERLNKTA